MKHTLSILTAVFAVLAFLISCGGSEDSNESGGIYGHVTDFVTGEDVVHANVQLRPGGDTTLTGSDGMFEFRDLRSGDYHITVSKAGYTDLVDDYTIEVDGRMVRRDVQLKVLPGIYGQVIDSETGTSIANAKVDLFRDSSRSSEAGSTQTDPDGKFEFKDLISDYFWITVSKAGYKDFVDDHEITVEDTMVRHDIRLVSCKDGYCCETKVFTPCKDEDTDYMWSARARQDMDWDSAIAYCDDLSEGGYDDWSLPSQEVLANFYNGNGSSKLGDTGNFWSSTPDGDSRACYVYFSNGNRYCGGYTGSSKSEVHSVRCVRW